MFEEKLIRSVEGDLMDLGEDTTAEELERVKRKFAPSYPDLQTSIR